MCSLTCLLTDDAKVEIKNLLDSKNYYVGVDNKMVFSASNDILNQVLVSMTGD